MRDQKVENWLTSHGYKWQYVKRVTFDEIDFERSRDNPARHDRKLDENRAIEYGEKYAEGVDFHAIIVMNLANPRDKIKYEMVTGMHRSEGAMLADKHDHDAYLVTEGDDYKREYAVRFANSLEGIGMTLADKISQSLWLHEHYRTPLAELARKSNLKPHTLQNAWNEERSRLRARRMNIDFPPSVAPGTVLALGQIALDNVYFRAAEWVSQTKHNSAEIKEMCAEIRKARDERAQIAKVEEYKAKALAEAEFQRAARSKARPIAITRMMRNVKALRNALLKPFHDLHISSLEDQLPASIAILNDMIERATLLKVEMEKTLRMSRPATRKAPDVRPEARP